MPETLDTFEFTGRSGNGGYDWDTLLNGSIYRLTRGTDFNAKVGSFITTVKKQAEKRELDVKTQTEDDDHLVIQAVPRGQ